MFKRLLCDRLSGVGQVQLWVRSANTPLTLSGKHFQLVRKLIICSITMVLVSFKPIVLHCFVCLTGSSGQLVLTCLIVLRPFFAVVVGGKLRFLAICLLTVTGVENNVYSVSYDCFFSAFILRHRS